MKFIITVDCTPEEAREFLGLPDVKSFQDEVTEAMRERTMDHLKAMDPENIMKTWMPAAVENFTKMQEAFFGSVAKAAGEKKD